MPRVVAVLLIAVTVEAVIWLHSAARTSPDAWPTSVAAGTTAALALITLWYAYLTHRLLNAQQAAPRIAGWETALRDLSAFLNRERTVIWTACGYFPLGSSDSSPPDIHALAQTKNELVRIRDHLLEVLGLLPRTFAAMMVPITARLVNAEMEVNALFWAIVDAMETGRAEFRTTWTWDDAKAAHEASTDPERSQRWTDIARGRWAHAVEELWDEVSSEVDRELVREAR